MKFSREGLEIGDRLFPLWMVVPIMVLLVVGSAYAAGTVINGTTTAHITVVTATSTTTTTPTNTQVNTDIELTSTTTSVTTMTGATTTITSTTTISGTCPYPPYC